MTTKTVEVNGVHYDAKTGLPVDSVTRTPATTTTATTQRPVGAKQTTHAARVHAATQKSQTLRRTATKKPAASQRPVQSPAKKRSMDIARSPAIKRFAPHPVAPKKHASAAQQSTDVAPTPHPLVEKTHKKITHAKQAVHHPTAMKSAKTIKQEAIAEALAQPKPHVKKKSFLKRHPRVFSVGTISLVILVIAAYFTYLNMPSLSVRVAAAQAGVAASYPDYRPDGYGINGPVTYSDNVVQMTFSANAGKTAYTITQAKSSWDSSAVREKVEKDSEGQFITTKERGLTVYTYNGNASWVNGGILYTITGDAPLSSDQILRIALSL